MKMISDPSRMLHTGNPPKSVSLQRVMSSMTATKCHDCHDQIIFIITKIFFSWWLQQNNDDHDFNCPISKFWGPASKEGSGVLPVISCMFKMSRGKLQITKTVTINMRMIDMWSFFRLRLLILRLTIRIDHSSAHLTWPDLICFTRIIYTDENLSSKFYPKNA